MADAFDMLHDFTCQNPQCGHQFKQTLRSLVNVKEVRCPACGHAEDIRVAKTTGELGKMFDVASEINKQRMKP